MQFRTELHIPAFGQQFSPGFKFLTIGSCFSDIIGQRLHDFKLDTLVNPFGTIFNPISQFELIEAALLPHEQEELPMTEQNGRWFAYGFHSTFSAESREALQTQIDEMLQMVKSHLAETNVVFFTFGTALVYQLASSDRIVANCHKMPSQTFTKRLLLAEEIVAGFAQIFALLKQHNPQIKAVLTLSPVRHLKETLPLNSVSKSVLRIACHYLAEMIPDVDYFPAYELLIDDLRDYRFYKDDMLHPSSMAEQYVWEKFSETYFDHNLKKFCKEWADVRQALQHKPFHPESAAHQEFLQGLLARLQEFNKVVNCTREIDLVRKQLQLPKGKKSNKKAPSELVELLSVLAASDILHNDDLPTIAATARNLPATTEKPVQESQPQQPVSEPETVTETKTEAKLPVEPQEGVATKEDAAPQPEQNQIRKISKSKKRRDKRKAKQVANAQAAHVNQAAQLPAVPEPVELPAEQPETLPEASLPKPEKPRRGPKQKAKRDIVPAVSQPDQIADPAAEPVAAPEVPVAATKKKPGRKPGKAKPTEVTQKTTPAPETDPTQNQQMAEQPGPVATEAPKPEPKKRPGRKPAAGVEALLNALASAQNAVAKPVTLTNPASPENAAGTDQKAVSQQKPKGRTKAAKPAPADLPLFPEAIAAPVTQPENGAPKPADTKAKEQRKDQGGAKKGKAKRIVLKKASPPKEK